MSTLQDLREALEVQMSLSGALATGSSSAEAYDDKMPNLLRIISELPKDVLLDLKYSPTSSSSSALRTYLQKIWHLGDLNLLNMLLLKLPSNVDLGIEIDRGSGEDIMSLANAFLSDANEFYGSSRDPSGNFGKVNEIQKLLRKRVNKEIRGSIKRLDSEIDSTIAQMEELKEQFDTMPLSDSLLILDSNLQKTITSANIFKSEFSKTPGTQDLDAISHIYQVYLQNMTALNSQLQDYSSGSPSEIRVSINSLMTETRNVMNNIAVVQEKLKAVKTEFNDEDEIRSVEASKRHLSRLPEKSFLVAKGDLIGGLIYVMDKPLGIEEGMVGISMDSKPYRDYIRSLVEVMEYKLNYGKVPHIRYDSSLEEKSRALNSDSEIYKRYIEFKSEKRISSKVKNLHLNEGYIDLILKDIKHVERRHSPKSMRLLLEAQKLHEIKSGQAYVKNIGLSGLIFNEYSNHCGIKRQDRFSNKIKMFIEHGNKVYMVKQDSTLTFGRTAPTSQKMLKTESGKKLQKLMDPRVVAGTLGLSAVAFGGALAGWKAHYLRINSPEQANSDAIIETAATKIAEIKGFSQVQEIETIEGTYPNGTPKIATIVTWANGCRDLTGRIEGGRERFNNVLVVIDPTTEMPIKLADNGELIIPTEIDADKNVISCERINRDGTRTTESISAYHNATMISDFQIAGLGESLVSVISLGDRDSIGSKGQNKGVIPMRDPNSAFSFRFFGIDFGKAFKGENPIVNSLSDDFTFINPEKDTERFKNMSILYDTTLLDKMKGIYLLAALRNVLTNKEEIISEFKKMGDLEFAMKLQYYPDSVGGINADLILLDNEIREYSKLALSSPNEETRNQYLFYADRLRETLMISMQTDQKILACFRHRMNLSPSNISLLDNLEKLTATEVSYLSPDNTVLLNHIRVERENRVAWQISPSRTSGIYNLICDETDPAKQRIIVKMLRDFGSDLFGPDIVTNIKTKQLVIKLSEHQLEYLKQKLTEDAIARHRNLPLVNQSIRTLVDQSMGRSIEPVPLMPDYSSRSSTPPLPSSSSSPSSSPFSSSSESLSSSEGEVNDQGSPSRSDSPVSTTEDHRATHEIPPRRPK